MAGFASADQYGSGWYGEVQLSVGREDNVSRSYRTADLMADTIASATLGIGYSRNASSQLRYVVSGYVTRNQHSDLDELSNTAVSLGADLSWQPRPGYQAPWYRLTVDLARLEHDDSEPRDGYLADLRISFNRRLGVDTLGRLGYGYHDLIFLEKSDDEANRDAAFDFARHEFFIGADYALGDSVTLVGEYSFQHGGFTSTVSGTPDPDYTYEAQTPDHVFQTCTPVRCADWYAYRTIADMHAIDVGIVFSTRGGSYDLSARYYDAKNDNGRSYDDWIIRAGAIWSF